jgi:hypothetical protein
MARAFEQSHEAYARKDGAAAKELSNEGKAHQREMDRLNAEASEWIFTGEFCPLPRCLVLTRCVVHRKQSSKDFFSPCLDDVSYRTSRV